MRNSTFAKMTVAFIMLGIFPIIIFSRLFIGRYIERMESVMIDNLQKMNAYTAQNVEEIIDSVDEDLEQIYKNTVGSNCFLYEILKDDTISIYTKRMYINNMINDIVNGNDYLAAIRFKDRSGEIYTAYSDKLVLTKKGVGFPNELTGIEPESYRKRFLCQAFDTSKYCLHSDNYTFTIARYYMDGSSVKRVKDTILGSIYADVDTEQIGQFVNKDIMGKQGGNYVVNLENYEYLYSDYIENYGKKAIWLKKYVQGIQGQSGRIITSDGYLIYTKIGMTSCYVLQRIVMQGMMQNVLTERNYLILLVVLSMIVLLGIYYIFSKTFTKPVKQLADAMKQIRMGNLDVSVSIATNDEMQYLGEGFNKMARELDQYINQVYKASIAQKDAELNALKMQIQPHYLYNTLDVIRMKAVEFGDYQVGELLESLSRQLRYLTDNSRDQIQLIEELNNIKEYFVIISVRYEKLYELDIQVRDADLSLMVPKLILQPAVENAVRHGLRMRRGAGRVMIKVGRKDSCLELVVMDNGIGMTQEQNDNLNRLLSAKGENGKVGIGLKNVYERIQYYYGPEYGFSVHGQINLGTIVSYRLPIVEASEGKPLDSGQREGI